MVRSIISERARSSAYTRAKASPGFRGKFLTRAVGIDISVKGIFFNRAICLFRRGTEQENWKEDGVSCLA
jgi:hypothetical protein